MEPVNVEVTARRWRYKVFIHTVFMYPKSSSPFAYKHGERIPGPPSRALPGGLRLGGSGRLRSSQEAAPGHLLPAPPRLFVSWSTGKGERGIPRVPRRSRCETPGGRPPEPLGSGGEPSPGSPGKGRGPAREPLLPSLRLVCKGRVKYVFSFMVCEKQSLVRHLLRWGKKISLSVGLLGDYGREVITVRRLHRGCNSNKLTPAASEALLNTARHPGNLGKRTRESTS